MAIASVRALAWNANVASPAMDSLDKFVKKGRFKPEDIVETGPFDSSSVEEGTFLRLQYDFSQKGSKPAAVTDWGIMSHNIYNQKVILSQPTTRVDGSLKEMSIHPAEGITLGEVDHMRMETGIIIFKLRYEALVRYNWIEMYQNKSS